MYLFVKNKNGPHARFLYILAYLLHREIQKLCYHHDIINIQNRDKLTVQKFFYLKHLQLFVNFIFILFVIFLGKRMLTLDV